MKNQECWVTGLAKVEESDSVGSGWRGGHDERTYQKRLMQKRGGGHRFSITCCWHPSIPTVGQSASKQYKLISTHPASSHTWLAEYEPTHAHSPPSARTHVQRHAHRQKQLHISAKYRHGKFQGRSHLIEGAVLLKILIYFIYSRSNYSLKLKIKILEFYILAEKASLATGFLS